MQTDSSAVCEKFYCLQKDGSKHVITWHVGIPYFFDGEWISVSFFDGMESRPIQIRGSSAMQALLLSATLGYSKLKELIKKGNVVSFFDDGLEAISAEELTHYYFPRLS
jgi:hypothetical protein